MQRRHMLAASAALLLGAPRARAGAADKVLRIGVQKYGTLVLLRERGSLEQRLAPLGWQVSWTEFPAGPQLLEGLNVGAIDLGTTGEAPPIFAQAAGADLVYVGYEPPAPRGEAILVPKDSPIATPLDLKGRKVALNKGSNVHYLLVRVLDRAGLAYGDIEPVYLPPADARAAFERGAVDAWAIWDPFLAAAQAATGARTLTDGQDLVSNHQFYLAAAPFAAAQPELVSAVLAELDTVDRWAEANPKAVAELFGPRLGIPAPVLEVALARMGYGVKPIDAAVAAEQQGIADAFARLGLIPKPITVRNALWKVQS
ncbi:MAG: sulfonate ABC transporter substrate-binding protein [Geminicoccaceae bacterium]